MARSMMQRRQEAERERNDVYQATLRRVFSVARPAPDFERALDEVRAGLAGQAIRDGALWRPKLKTRDAGRLRLAAARYLYARYPVGGHLEAIWLSDEGLPDEAKLLRKRWYVAVAKGDSLFKAGASDWLSRKEVHAFVTAPAGLDFGQAFWFAIATGFAPEGVAAMRIARSKIARNCSGDIGFWREAARLFAGSGAGAEQIDDLCDYLAAKLAADAGYSVKGRTLASLRRGCDEWHRDVAAVARIEALRRRYAGTALDGVDGGRWAGSPLANWTWQPPGEEAKRKPQDYQVVQLNSAADLVSESSAMRHCVWTYAGTCIAGHASIWSLRKRRGKFFDRLLTIEVDRFHKAAQVRGFGNRLATVDEKRILDRWARANGVTLG